MTGTHYMHGSTSLPSELIIYYLSYENKYYRTYRLMGGVHSVCWSISSYQFK